MSAVYKSRDEQRQKAANEVWMPESAHNKIWQDGAKWADENPMVTAGLLWSCVNLLRLGGADINITDVEYTIKKFGLK